MAARRCDESNRSVSLYPGGISSDEETDARWRPDHQQWFAFCQCTATEFGTLHCNEACRDWLDPFDLTRWTQLQYSLRPDRHWKCCHRKGGKDRGRRSAGPRMKPSWTS